MYTPFLHIKKVYILYQLISFGRNVKVCYFCITQNLVVYMYLGMGSTCLPGEPQVGVGFFSDS